MNAKLMSFLDLKFVQELSRDGHIFDYYFFVYVISFQTLNMDKLDILYAVKHLNDKFGILYNTSLNEKGLYF